MKFETIVRPAEVAVSKKRLVWIDRFKGLAILSIVIFHFFQNYHDRLVLAEILSRNGAKIGFAAVDFFLLLRDLILVMEWQ